MISRRHRRFSGVAIAALAIVGVAGSVNAVEPSPGPPFPDPVEAQRIYDFAGIFSADVRAQAESRLLDIEVRTGSQIAVLTQSRQENVSDQQADADALALINQWGVGRRGYDDGLVVLFDLNPDRVHGQVRLQAGPGYRDFYLSNAARQRIFDLDMRPLLAQRDFDGALAAAVARFDAVATPERADSLEQARFAAVSALVGVLFGFVGQFFGGILTRARERRALLHARKTQLYEQLLLLGTRIVDRTAGPAELEPGQIASIGVPLRLTGSDEIRRSFESLMAEAQGPDGGDPTRLGEILTQLEATARSEILGRRWSPF
jgi:uncharacterized membrane protein YgcG